MKAEVSLARVRGLAEECRSKGSRQSAVFFADKACTLSHTDSGDLFNLCRALRENGEQMRAIHILRGGLVTHSSKDGAWRYVDASRLLIGRCLADLDLWEECLEEIGDGESADAAAVYDDFEFTGHSFGGPGPVSGTSLRSLSCLNLLRGRAHAALQNVSRATHFYVAALKADPTCVEAFSLLADGKLLKLEDQESLLESLKFFPEDMWLKDIYALKVCPERAVADSGKRNSDTDYSVFDVSTRSGTWQDLSGNSELLCLKARGYEQAGSHASALSITTHLLDKDPYDLSPAETHIASLVALGRQNELFLSAHRLIEAHPTKAIAWYAVGCYYLVTGQSDRARVYFSRATHQQDGYACPAAWLAFGHSFAVQDESDQAMAAYRTASRMFPGYFLPQLCMGMEYARTNNLSLSHQYFMYAEAMSPSNPLVHNEAGALHFRNGNYAKAFKYFEIALTLFEGNVLVQSQMPELRDSSGTRPSRGSSDASTTWRRRRRVEAGMSVGYETVLVNLAHCYRKLGSFAEAAACFEDALYVNAECASTHSALGFTWHCMGDVHSAIQCYHRALGIRADDNFTNEMLSRALKDCARLPFDVAPT